MSEDAQARIKELRQRTLGSIRKLRFQELSILEAEVLDRLIEGRKTAVELAENIYGLSKDDPGRDSACVRIRKILRKLQQRGFVSTGMFGRDRPYRVTTHGIAVLASIAPEMERPKVITVRDAVVFLATAVCGTAMYIYSGGSVGSPESGLALSLFALFFALIGFSASLFLQIVRRVL